MNEWVIGKLTNKKCTLDEVQKRKKWMERQKKWNKWLNEWIY